MNGGQAPFYYLDEEFVNWMKDNNDPRLVSIAVRYVGAQQEGDQVEEMQTAPLMLRLACLRALTIPPYPLWQKDRA